MNNWEPSDPRSIQNIYTNATKIKQKDMKNEKEFLKKICAISSKVKNSKISLKSSNP